jgi:hypothetical protein
VSGATLLAHAFLLLGFTPLFVKNCALSREAEVTTAPDLGRWGAAEQKTGLSNRAGSQKLSSTRSQSRLKMTFGGSLRAGAVHRVAPG